MVSTFLLQLTALAAHFRVLAKDRTRIYVLQGQREEEARTVKMYFSNIALSHFG